MTKGFDPIFRRLAAWILVFVIAVSAADFGLVSVSAAERGCENGRHNYGEPVWQWSEDYSFATALFVCGDCSENLAKAADMAEPKVTEATCDREGSVEYAASVTLDGAVFTSTRCIVLEMEPHDIINDYCRVCGAADPDMTTGECVYLEEAELEDSSFVLMLGGVNAGRFLFHTLGEGWSIRASDGRYLAAETEETEPEEDASAGPEVCLVYSETPFAWIYREGGFGVVVEPAGEAADAASETGEVALTEEEEPAQPEEKVYYLALEGDVLTLTREAESAQAVVCVEEFRTSHRYGDGEEVEATCAEPGGLCYTCTRCGYRDYENPTAPLGHTYTEWTVTAEGDCLNDGARHRECQTCGLVENEVIPAGHSYDVTWNWAEDYAACTAVIACTVCREGTDGHGGTVEATVTKEVIQPDYENAGQKRYIAEAEYNGQTFTDVVSIEIPRVTAPVPEIGSLTLSDNSGKVYGHRVDDEEKVLYLDIHKDGIAVGELVDALVVELEYDSDDAPELRVAGTVNFRDREIVVNGASLTIVAENLDADASQEWTVIILGDTNLNGRVESGDAVKMNRHYASTELLENAALMAADTNCNGRIDSGDAVKNRIKYTSERTDSYASALS